MVIRLEVFLKVYRHCFPKHYHWSINITQRLKSKLTWTVPAFILIVPSGWSNVCFMLYVCVGLLIPWNLILFILPTLNLLQYMHTVLLDSGGASVTVLVYDFCFDHCWDPTKWLNPTKFPKPQLCLCDVVCYLYINEKDL